MPASGDSGELSVSVINLPSSDFLTNSSPEHRPATSRPVSIGTVFSMAPSVAAQMTLERELVSNCSCSAVTHTYIYYMHDKIT